MPSTAGWRLDMNFLDVYPNQDGAAWPTDENVFPTEAEAWIALERKLALRIHRLEQRLAAVRARGPVRLPQPVSA